MNVRIDFPAGFQGQGGERSVRFKGLKTHLGNFTRLISKDSGIHVMVDGIL